MTGMLAGCSAAFMDPSAYNIFQQEKVNLTEKSYAAADYIDQQARNFVSKTSLIRAVPLEDADEPRLTSDFAKQVPEQVGIRLGQLGYRLDLSGVLVTENTDYLRPGMGAGEQPRFILGGTYARRRTDVDVSLRIMDAQSQRVVAVFDYSMPMDRGIGDASKPEARIFQTGE